jgi:hypothetical protein
MVYCAHPLWLLICTKNGFFTCTTSYDLYTTILIARLDTYVELYVDLKLFQLFMSEYTLNFKFHTFRLRQSREDLDFSYVLFNT